MASDKEYYNLVSRIHRNNKNNPNKKIEIPQEARDGYNRHRAAKHAENPEINRQRDRKRYYKDHEKTLEKVRGYQKEYRKTDTYKNYQQEYRKRSEFIEAETKRKRIQKWRIRDVKHPDFEELHDIWKSATNCADCDVILVEGQKGNNRKCLDHDHTTGLFRDIVCHACNLGRGVTDRLSALNL